MSAALESVKSIFLAALEKPSAAERVAYLDQACAGDATLRRRVEELLQAHGEPDSLLDRPAAPADNVTKTLTPSGTGESAPASDGSAAAPGRDGSDFAFLASSHEAGSLGRLDHYDVLE